MALPAPDGRASGSPQTYSTRAHLALLVVIVLIGAGLRLWRINWGLADRLAFADETYLWKPLLEAFVPIGLHSFFDTPLFYPTLYHYLAGLTAWAADAVGIIDARSPDGTFEMLSIARLLSAAFDSATIAVLYRIGAVYFSPATGLLAAAFVAVTPLHVLQTHYASVDPLLGFATTLAVLAACRLHFSPDRGAAIWSGVCAGLAFTAKYTGLQALGLPVFALLAHTGSPAGWRAALRLSILGWVLLAFAATTAVTCPPCVLTPSKPLNQITRHAEIVTRAATVFRNNELAESLGWYGKPYLYQIVAGLPFVLGWALYLATAFGIVRAVIRRTPVDVIVLLHIATLFLFVAGSDVTFPRYLLPLLPACCLLAARGVQDIRRDAIRRVVAVAVLGYTFALSASQVDRFSYDQQRSVARWIKTHAADTMQLDRRPVCGVAVGYQSVPGDQMLFTYFTLTDPLEDLGIDVRPLSVHQWFQPDVDFLVLSEWLITSARRDEPDGDLARALDRLTSAASPYEPGPVWRPEFFTSGLYTILDPAFIGDLWQGEIGFRVFVRKPDG